MVNRFILLAFFFSHFVQAQTGTTLLYEMAEHANKIKSFTATITKSERIDGTMEKQISSVKLLREPFSLYLRQEFPKEGVEVLSRAGQTKVLVNPNSFPWINLNLDPFGSLMRRNQHHTVYDSGFDLMTSILLRELGNMSEEDSVNVKYFGTKIDDGREVHHIEFINPSYRIIDYVVMPDEDVIKIAKKLNVNEYYILELNESVDFYDDVKVGQIIKVPSHYASRMTLYVDVEFMLPLIIWAYDDKGLFEKYAYSKFVLNPTLLSEEFEADYPDYGF